MADANWQFWIDRGGTFTDIVAQRPDGRLVVHKLLSENPEQYADAAIAGIRALLNCPEPLPLPREQIAAIKMGTTVATNALLERQGVPTVLLITQGLGDALRIGYQNRPQIFARQIVLPEMLYGRVIEVNERIDATGQTRQGIMPDEQERLRSQLQIARDDGFVACAIVLLHGYRFPLHEQQVAAIAKAAGFAQISVSHQVSPRMKLVSRGDTTVADAYLSPILRRYVNQVATALVTTNRQVVPKAISLEFMQSNGGLTPADTFQGKDSLLSGPAGGIVGAVKIAQAAGFRQIITFDMGGTSTDVAHFAGEYERSLETEIAGVRVCVPMMSIHTVAAGGGSLLQFDGARFRVGPESAGANPGPASYGKGGGLTVTDCNVMLGRIQPAFFPAVFGPEANQPLDHQIVQRQFGQLVQSMLGTAAMTPESIAQGFLAIAVEKMATAIQQISVQRGYDVTTYTLCCFGGAGGQHACMIADALGMRQILLHPLAGVLSAYGMGLADRREVRQQSVELPLVAPNLPLMQPVIQALIKEAQQCIVQQLVEIQSADIQTELRLHLRYEGTDSTLVVPYGDADGTNAIDTIQQSFEQQYQQRYGFIAEHKTLIVAMVEVELILPSQVPVANSAVASRTEALQPVSMVEMYLASGWQAVPVYQQADLQVGDRIEAPALIVEATGTNVLDPGWSAIVDAAGNLVLQRTTAAPTLNVVRDVALPSTPDPIRLEIFNHLFMSVAEQMGITLQQTSSSVNIKERLDFSCAIFDGQGELIANAPHIPVHLGSMGESVRSLIESRGKDLRPGDVYVMNNPYNGGTHLPDVTVMTPVFLTAEALQPTFYVAARGHHADLGGMTPGSMPPHSRRIEQEGVLIDHFQLVDRGVFQTDAMSDLLTQGDYPVRNLSQNLADLQAQVAANQKGVQKLRNMVAQYGPMTVTAYMHFVQENAEAAVRQAIESLQDSEFVYPLDGGSQIRVKITIDPQQRAATIDFTGTSPQSETNFNAPLSVVKAAVVYVFRTLVDDDIPLNAGCLKPLNLIVPVGCLLNPRYPAAVVAGNVEISQAVTNALYGALGTLAASQGTMNNFTFGNERYQYYETIAGGAGAGDGFNGAAAVQTHMTNSRLTDPEVLESRFPVLLKEFRLRPESGGGGKYHGGNGVVRKIQFLESMTANILSGHRRVAPFGLAQGLPGKPGVNYIERSDGTIEPLAGTAQVVVHPGDVFTIETPGGGGFGAAN
ncbi:hydantoinase B/oxoprolinase family protein [filamentous cyanobacterium LEGE 11480]|uniref:Hydantoinase B/oxoprolinase family protein n=1 Tax=Romeriopsis navalis LEGE 11480 TaxID=2777977 RepID=A0A928VQ49_9CYAN|nr:hydantoinase B/oxoprolinase family protein [Romeriopsis navalis]MBE9030866.1 hydantoinase B/oxoprolinase family protein [Romeriopsis navalis LEGE 11480]